MIALFYGLPRTASFQRNGLTPVMNKLGSVTGFESGYYRNTLETAYETLCLLCSPTPGVRGRGLAGWKGLAGSQL